MNENSKGKNDINNDNFDEYSNWSLHNLSFVIESNQKVAFVGCGNSVVLQLLSSLYEVDEGQILIDGIDIKKIDPQKLRTIISIFPPETFLSTNDDYEASKLGNAHDFIFAERKNFDEIKHQKNHYYKDSEKAYNSVILLYDDVKNLFNEEKSQIFDAVQKTKVISASKLETVLNVEKIIVLKEGNIESEGKHDDLIKENKFYKNLIKSD